MKRDDIHPGTWYATADRMLNGYSLIFYYKALEVVKLEGCPASVVCEDILGNRTRFRVGHFKREASPDEVGHARSAYTRLRLKVADRRNAIRRRMHA